MKSTRRRAASARKSIRTPTSSSARPSTRASRASSASRSSRPASITPSCARLWSCPRRSSASPRWPSACAPKRGPAWPSRRRSRFSAPRASVQAPPLAETPAEAPQPVPVRPAPKADAARDRAAGDAAAAAASGRFRTAAAAGRAAAGRRRAPDAGLPFIPPQAERRCRPTRMPRVDDLPMPAQIELHAARGEADAAAHHDQRRMTLLQRLATVGLGRKDGPAGPPAPAERPWPRRSPGRRGAARPAVSPAHAEYSKRAATAGLPPGPRRARSAWPRPGAAQGLDDDQLEIPAFLRRQTN